MNNFKENVNDFCKYVKLSDTSKAKEAYHKIEAALGPFYRCSLLSSWTLYQRGDNLQMIDKVCREINELFNENGERNIY